MADYDRDRGGRGERGDRGDRGERFRRPRRGDDGDDSGGEFSPRPRRGRRGGAEYCPEGKCFDYKDVDTLERFVNEVGKIKPRRQTGNCARCQRELAREVKRARILGLLPYIATTD